MSSLIDPSYPKHVDVAERWWLHGLLWVATFMSIIYSQWPRDIPTSFQEGLLASLPFACTLLSILCAHEMGHYITGRLWQVNQSLPYFIPAPTFFGTLGAVIIMRSPPHNVRALLYVAMMGPYAGLVLAIPATAWGLAHSVPVNPSLVTQGLEFGDSLLFAALTWAFSPNGADIILHPVAVAGWIGLLMTSINLIPAAQLDGGHIAYALFGKYHYIVSLFVVVTLITFGVRYSFFHEAGSMYAGSAIWLLWGVFIGLMGLKHPPVQDASVQLTHPQTLLGFLALLIFILTFIPVPIKVIAP